MGVGTLRRNREEAEARSAAEAAKAQEQPAAKREEPPPSSEKKLEELSFKALQAKAEEKEIDHVGQKLNSKAKIIEVLKALSESPLPGPAVLDGGGSTEGNPDNEGGEADPEE